MQEKPNNEENPSKKVDVRCKRLPELNWPLAWFFYMAKNVEHLYRDGIFDRHAVKVANWFINYCVEETMIEIIESKGGKINGKKGKG